MSTTVGITVEVSDDKGIDKVDFIINGSLKHTDSSSPYNYSWDTTAESEGLYIVKATAYDTANQTASDQHTVKVGNPPSIAITNPVEGSTVTATVSVTVNASDDRGIDKVQFYIDGVCKSTDTASPYSYSWDTTAESGGSHTVKVIAYDTANQTATDQHSVTVDNSPAISITNPVDGSTVTATVSITADASDDRGIDRVQFYIDGV